ncbi:MAG TPA: TonB-dependent receptor [Croceibacterium sp.]
MIARLVAPALVLAVPGGAWAQAENSPSRAIVVTASRSGDAGGVTVVDAEAIERRQATSLLEVLADVPGVRASSLGGPAGPSFLSIRGGEGNFTAVMLDGIRLNDPTNSEGGAFDFSLLDPAAVERIEVARTAGSAIHGSDALSGVVQIVTRDPALAGLDLAASGWADSRYGGAGSATVAGGWGSGGLLGSFGYYDAGEGNPASTVRRSQGLARGGQALGGFRLDATALYAETQGEAFPQDSGGPELAVIRERETREGDLAVAGLSLTRDPAARVRPQLSLSYALQHHDSDSPPIAPGVLDGVPASRSEARFARLEGIGSLAADFDVLTVVGGGAILREEGRSAGVLDFGFELPVAFAGTRETLSGFAEASLRLPAGLSAGGALRFDDLSGGGSYWTGRGTLAWDIEPGGPRVFARVANGYKLPSFYALGHPLIGNAALEPEEGRSVEAGLEWPLPQGGLGLSVFDNRFRNLVDFDPATFQLVNRDRVDTQGLEASARARIGEHWELQGALTHLAVDSATPLRGRPAWSGNARLIWQHGRWEVTAAARGNSSFDDSSIPTGAVVTEGHVEGDLGVRYAISPGLAVRLTVLNLGDSDNWTATGTPAPGRSIRLALTFN